MHILLALFIFLEIIQRRLQRKIAKHFPFRILNGNNKLLIFLTLELKVKTLFTQQDVLLCMLTVYQESCFTKNIITLDKYLGFWLQWTTYYSAMYS